MRNFATILLLASFFAFQYARQVSYWECRVANYFRTSDEKCDCDALAGRATYPADTFPLPAVHTHLHLDESFFPAEMIRDETGFAVSKAKFSISNTFFLFQDHQHRLLRPPRPV